MGWVCFGFCYLILVDAVVGNLAGFCWCFDFECFRCCSVRWSLLVSGVLWVFVIGWGLLALGYLVLAWMVGFGCCVEYCGVLF